MSQNVSIGLIQMSCTDDPDDNLDSARSKIREAAGQGAQVICLPELFRTPYFCKEENEVHFDLAETVPGPTPESMVSLAKELCVVLIVPVFERRAAGIYHNTVAVIDAGGEFLGIYRKMHIPDDPSFYEKYYFTPGDLGFKTFDTAHGKMGTLICWDQWYPEAARITALQGAGILFYPPAIGWLPGEKDTEIQAQLDSWRTVQRGHAIANNVFVASLNRVGAERGPAGKDGITFWGHSFLCDPQGIVLAEASGDQEEIVVTSIDLSRTETQRRAWPFLRDRRIDAYDPILKRFIDE